MAVASSRFSALDGLRGVAALVVVVHHCLLVSPLMAAGYYGGDVGDNPVRLALMYTPLHLVWGGAEAVVVFFVLSGFVLSRAIRSRSFDWFSYFPSRVLRLYVPVVGAIVFGFVVLMMPHVNATSSPWLQRDSSDYDLGTVLQDLTLVGGTSGVVSPLWTLRWEVIFSLLLPVAAYAVRVIPAWLLGVLCVGLSTLGAAQDVAAMQYLPIFGVGVALEGEWDRISRTVDRMTRRAGGFVWTGILVLAVTMLSMHWLLLAPLGHAAAVALSQGPIVVGAALLVIMATHFGPLQRLLTWRPIAWLGGISFSLYLIHEPLVLMMAGASHAARWTVLTAVPLALIVAWVFWLVVERPAHHLSRTVRARATWKAAAPAQAASDSAAEEAARSEQDRTPIHA
ncbi:acyltransferase [Microbacterium protaetiae]|uniref:Acyltransferase n=1 Tax=Microbacterium protaetiae TaxID=2509458 RepID=A0A4P6EG53_9MICO|nr:acyltransferase [Microbacterium protaetiae]QAY61284.1 acyltransferase [Microbacterium protaetiae]